MYVCAATHMLCVIASLVEPWVRTLLGSVQQGSLCLCVHASLFRCASSQGLPVLYTRCFGSPFEVYSPDIPAHFPSLILGGSCCPGVLPCSTRVSTYVYNIGRAGKKQWWHH